MVEPPPPVPDLDWAPERARAFADAVVDLWEEFLRRLPDLPVAADWTIEDVSRAVVRAIPEEPLTVDELLGDLRTMTFDWSMYPGHPRFMAYISGTGTVPGAAAELLAAGLNMNAGGWRLGPSATEVELAVVRWFADRFGLGPRASGLLTSGGAMATFVALKVARDSIPSWDVQRDGVRGGPPLRVYASEEAHVVTDRAGDMLGLGRQNVRRLPVDDGYRMRVDALAGAVEEDLANGLLPVAVVATAGTTGTGAIDPLPAIADVCAEHGIWLHVDAAYGGPAILAEDLRPRFAGIERADSVSFDPHKWLYVPLATGCVLVRDGATLARAFAADASYVYEDKERSGHGVDLAMLGPQFSRSFQALKLWASLLAHGTRAYGRRISHDAELARYMGARVDEHPELELCTPVELSICCFRYVPADLAAGAGRAAYLSDLNRRILTELQLDGRAYISNAVLRGDVFALRACIVNFRTEAPDVDATLEVVLELGAKLDAELRPEALRP